MTSDAYPRSNGLVERWGHYSPELLIASIGLAIVLAFNPVGGLSGVAVPVGLMAFIVATWLMMRRHDRTLCERCMASMPLNPAEQANRYTRRFWMAHTGSERRFMIPYLIVLIASNFAMSTPGRIFWATMQASMIFLILSYSTHRRLQPWCPWCSDGGGGSRHDVDPVTPDPVPGSRLQLT
ncbi:MAG: hypothetical protein QOG80_1909 [Pseudonocardiales bacterium]|jgi:hypothetical protein|nr:hypothetical protein [Pseudonocardiales bacterium]